MPRYRLLIALALIAAIVAVAAFYAAVPGRRMVEAVQLLRAIGELQPAGGAPAAAEPESFTFEIAGRFSTADLYEAAPPARALIVLVPGLAPDGKDDARLVDLALALSRAHFTVLVPDMPSLAAQRVSPENIREIADALVYLAAQRDAGQPQTYGVAAISYAVGPALLATLEPDLSGKVDFLVGIGGYYDVNAVIAYFTTGQYRDSAGGPWQHGTPNEFGKWLFVGANVQHVEDMRDRVTLLAIARRRQADPAADVADLVPLLGPEGRAIYDLLAHQDPGRTDALVAGLPESLRTELAGLDLKGRDLAGAPRQVLLIHGRDDRIIPASESAALAAALPPGRAHLYLVDSLAHADLAPGGWRDLLTLSQAAYRLLAIRDGVDR
jgi:pimeloyl-ACP methyl ester carboxylesterase